MSQEDATPGDAHATAPLPGADEIHWRPDSQDASAAWRGHSKLGRVQKFGNVWYWSLEADQTWSGPVATIDAAKEAILAKLD